VTAPLAASSEGVVVALKSEGAREAESALSSLGPTETLGDRLRLVRPRAAAKSARALWIQALRRAPEADWACPMLNDAAGHELYPTGALVVRFRDRPSREVLRKVGEPTVLTVEDRNEFVPRQVTLRPRRPREVYLPALVARIARRPEVESAWLATRGRYQRA
jgi:hypothetical protein